MKLKHFFYALILIGFGVFITYRISANKAKSELSNDKFGKDKPSNVSGIVVKTQTFDTNLSLSGSLEANEQVEIRSEVSGIVEAIYFKEGASVSKGQVLFKVNDIELRAQLGQAKTKESLASENERRAKLLLQKEAISQEEYEIARADFKSAQAQSELIRAQISKTAVKAPFAGKIGLRSISSGTYITPSILVAKLVNTSKLKITFSIPEKYATQVKLNSNLSFKVAGSDESYTAKIYALEPEISVNTRTLQVRAVTDNEKGKLFPGTFAEVILPLDKINDAILIPTEAIIPVQNGKKVFVSNAGKAHEIKVETGTRTATSVVILSGLKVGDTILTSGIMSLKEEALVKVKIKL
jgi:membrane fusion protein (multidrug efflux system)